MNIKTIVVGPLQENCYIIEYNSKCIIIDPGDEYEKIISNIKYELEAILITHYHFDHIGALNKIKEKYGLKENDYSKISIPMEIIDTPGHTNESKTFYFKDYNVMFVGDFIFNDGIGRVDLPTGNINQMKESLLKIFKYPLETVVYPGHGSITTLKKEKENLNL